MKNIDNTLLTDEFKNEILNFHEEKGYTYKVIVSSTNKKVYGRHKDEDIIKYHLEHISTDYLEEYEYETVLSHGYVKKNLVVGEFLFGKKR